MTKNNPKEVEAELNQFADAVKETNDDNRGPTIVMQGLSGKKITADVKVVKVKKKAAPKSTVEADKPEAAETAVEKIAAPVITAVEQAASVVKTTEAVPEVAPVKSAAKTAEKPAASVQKTVEKVQDAVQPAVEKLQVAQTKVKETVHEAVEHVKADVAKVAKSVAQEVKKELASATKKETAPATPASSASKKTAETKPAVPTAASSATGKTITETAPNQVEKSTAVDPKESSLAATVAYFAAQAAARKKAAEQRVKASSQRHAHTGDRNGERQDRGPRQDRGERRPYSGGPGGQGGNQRSPRNGNFGQGGPRFSPADKDEEPKLQSHPRKAPAKRPNTFESEILSNPREAGRNSFASRDQAKKTNHYDRKEGDRNARGRQNNGKRRDHSFGDDEFIRGRRKGKKDVQEAAPVIHAVLTNVSLPEHITVKEFAEAIKKTSAEVIKALMKLGVMATLNQDLDYDTASILAEEFGIKTDKIVEVTEEDILFDDRDDEEDNHLLPRPPVVCVMGHVDHGKTSLLDRIRQASVAVGEAGGITQHIGAYMVELNERKITFLDTPGHEAFTTMRARGAQATDIAILVVAADDGVMPQTIEAINHAKAANTQVVVAINKMDRPGANPDRVKEELSKHELIPEEWGGTTVMVPVSAKTGEGIQELLEMVLLTADLLELKANPDRQAKGIVIEAKLDKQRGAVATLLVKRGTLRTGDTVVMGEIVGRIRAMTDATGKALKAAGPSVPVEIIGLPDVPEAGETFYQVEDEKIARQLAEKRRIKKREATISGSSRMSLDNLFEQMGKGEVKDLNLIVKADVQGSVEAVNQALTKLSNDEINVHIVHSAVGAITESDIRLAEVSNAIVIGFNVRPAANVQDQAKAAEVDLRLYRVIYHAIEDIEAAMKGMLAPKMEEVELGRVEIRQVFKASNIGTIGGGYVTQGKIMRNCRIRLVRDGIIIWDGKLASLKRFKDDVREVAHGYECGISLENYNDIKEGDVAEAYEITEVERD